MTFHIDNRGGVGCNNPPFGKYFREKCSGELGLSVFGNTLNYKTNLMQKKIDVKDQAFLQFEFLFQQIKI